MTQSLKVYKLNAMPSTYEASALYFVKNPNDTTFDVFLTSKNGQVLFRMPTTADASTVIDSLKNTPNGIAGLNADGIIPAIDGQNTSLKSNNDFVWADNIQQFVVKKTSGTNNPTFGTLFGNMEGLLFSSSAMNQIWADFHIPLDYAMGTPVFPHLHWMPITTHVGTVRWGIESCVAKGFGQEAFSAPVTSYVEHTITSNSNRVHFISGSDAIIIDSASLEPSAVIKLRFFRDGAHPNDTFPADVHAWQGGHHYRVGQIGTRNHKPDFFTTVNI